MLIFLLLEAVIGPRLSLFNRLGLPVLSAWLRIPILLGLAIVLIYFFARCRLPQIGLTTWRNWRLTETSYFIQAFLIANVIFGFLNADDLRMIVDDTGLWGRAVVVVFTNMLWGFYQELVYRGVLQTELVRRWGSVLGILCSNLLFTFGPLHFYHFSSKVAGHALPMFTAIFLIGLFFGVVFRRSGNLVIVGVLHGLGNCYTEGLGTICR